MDLLQLGDDELSPHVRHFHLELLDLQVPQFDRVFQVVLFILSRHPSLVVFFDNCGKLLRAKSFKEYYQRWVATEDEKYDLEYSVKLRDLQIQELEMEVSDMRGKFIIPKLKKVHAFKLMGNEES
jgi:hypothetical protein